METQCRGTAGNKHRCTEIASQCVGSDWFDATISLKFKKHAAELGELTVHKMFVAGIKIRQREIVTCLCM